MQQSENIPLDNLEQIIKDCTAGMRIAQNRLYELLCPRMMPVCMRYANDRNEAEEILQEGFIRVFTHIAQFKNQGSFEGWVRKIMVNAALQRYRDKVRLYPVVALQEDSHEKSVNEETYSKIGYKDLMELVQNLPPAYRLVFNLYVFEGMKHREIASNLGISEGTSKSNLYDARLILQREIMKLEQVNTQKLACL